MTPPDPTYPTLSASDGARHVAIGPMLGVRRDVEPEGLPAAFADGDDGSGTDDDDGVALTSFMVPGATASLRVVASDAALLNGWVDFNEDGDWSDPNEQVFVDEVLVAGANALSFVVPANAPADLVGYSRFRVDTVGGLGPTGVAFDGEVEDYALQVDECALDSDDCGANAACTDLPDGFSCACNDGYTGDGATCADIDECSVETHDCDANAICTNTPGSYACACACRSGFSGDGTSCTATGGGSPDSGGCSSVPPSGALSQALLALLLLGVPMWRRRRQRDEMPW